MRLPLIFGCSGLMLVCVACSNHASAPVAEGDATINFKGCIYNGTAVSGPGGVPTATDYGATVLNGSTGGYHVSCSVTHNGTYAVNAQIDSPDMSLSVDSSDVTVGAHMLFFVAGASGTQQSIESSDATNNKPSSNCVLTTASTAANFVVKPGTIFAQYDCSHVTG